MDYRTLAKTDIKVSALVFGAWAAGGWMWGGTDDQETIKALHAAYDLGMTTIDTAPVYGGGHSESVVGQAIKGRRDKVQVLTKFGLNWDQKKGQYYFSTRTEEGKTAEIYKYAGKESVIKECEVSLKRLGTDYIDLYQIHWPDPTTPVAETMEAIAQLLKAGKIRAFGVSNFSREQMIEAAQNGPVISNQVPYSMVNRGIEKELAPYCIEHGLGLLVYSPLQRGILTGKIGPDYTFKESDHRTSNPYFKPVNLEKINRFLKKLQPLAHELNATLAQLVLAWTMAQPGITAVLVGARNIRQVEENARGADLKIDRTALDKINTLLEPLGQQLDL